MRSGHVRALGDRPPLAGRAFGDDTYGRLVTRCGLQRVSQFGRGLRHGGVSVDDVGQVVARAGVVESLDCGVEAGPELWWSAAAGPGSQLVGRPRAF